MTTNKVFVYGTLKAGGRFDNSYVATKRTKIDKAHIKGVKILNLGSFPGVIESEDEGSTVFGEIHEFENIDSVIKEMDRIEGYTSSDEKNSLFVRKVVDVVNENTGEPEKVFMYRFNQMKYVNDPDVVESGVW